MKKNTIILLSSIVLVIALAALAYNFLLKDYKPDAIAPLPESSTTGSEAEKVPAPDFTAYDKDGNKVKLSDLKGKPLVINFWASWCDPCKSEMDDFEAVYKEKGEDVVFMMVNMTDGQRETEEIAKAFIKDRKYTFPVYLDIDEEAAMTYGVSSLPTTYFIDKDGNIITGAKGAIDGETLLRGIGMITE